MARLTPSLDTEQVSRVRELAEMGVPQTRLAQDFGVSARTIYSVVHGRGAYADKGRRGSSQG